MLQFLATAFSPFTSQCPSSQHDPNQCFVHVNTHLLLRFFLFVFVTSILSTGLKWQAGFVSVRGNAVWLVVDCPSHGQSRALYCSSIPFFRRVSVHNMAISQYGCKLHDLNSTSSALTVIVLIQSMNCS
jgi:hypothetical protein